MLIILFAAIIIFLSAKSRFNRAHMEGSSTNYSGRCGGGGCSPARPEEEAPRRARARRSPGEARPGAGRRAGDGEVVSNTTTYYF